MRRMTTTSHRPGGRKMTLRTTCEIRTRDAVQRAAAVLEMSEKVGLFCLCSSVRSRAVENGVKTRELGRMSWESG